MSRTPGQNLFSDIQFILGRAPSFVVDVGCHYGDTSKNYLDEFPQCEVLAFEADADNLTNARKMLAPYGERVTLVEKAVARETGEVSFHVNSHDGTHSTLEIGEQRFWASYVDEVEVRKVPAVRLDEALPAHVHIDLLHMDIQGGELEALRGADRLLRDRRISLIYSEVEMVALYKDQPLFWDLGKFLDERGYRLYSLYHQHYHRNNPRTLAWADALFVSKELAEVPEHVREEEVLESLMAVHEVLPDFFSDEPVFHNGAAKEADQIAVSGPRWAYAAAWSVAGPRPAGPIVVEMEVEVLAGSVGVGCLTDDMDAFVGNEMMLTAAEGMQTTRILAADGAAVGHLMLRNVAVDGAAGRVVIRAIRAMAPRAAASTGSEAVL